VTTVLASRDYPESPRTAMPIVMPRATEDAIVFHAGTSRDATGRLIASGGRVLSVTGLAPTVHDAQKRSLAAAHSIQFDGKQFRSDIGWRELSRHARAS